MYIFSNKQLKQERQAGEKDGGEYKRLLDFVLPCTSSLHHSNGLENASTCNSRPSLIWTHESTVEEWHESWKVKHSKVRRCQNGVHIFNPTLDYLSNDMISLITLRQVNFCTQTVPKSVLRVYLVLWLIRNPCCWQQIFCAFSPLLCST